MFWQVSSLGHPGSVFNFLKFQQAKYFCGPIKRNEIFWKLFKKKKKKKSVMVYMPILTCIFFTFNWLTLTSEIHFVNFHPVVASCLLSRGKRKCTPLGMRLLWKYIRNYFLVYNLISPFCYLSKTTKNLKLKFWICNQKNDGLSFDIKKYTTSGWALGDENVIGIRGYM